MAIENFGIVDVDHTGQSVRISIRHFDTHGHPYALLGEGETRRLISHLEGALKSGKLASNENIATSEELDWDLI